MSKFPSVFLLCYQIQVDLYVYIIIYIYTLIHIYIYIFMSCCAMYIFLPKCVLHFGITFCDMYCTAILLQRAKKHEGNKECLHMFCTNLTVCSLFLLEKTSKTAAFKPCSIENKCYQLNPTEPNPEKNDW